MYRPVLQGREKEYVIDCLDSTWISSRGEYIKLFEDSFAEFLNIPASTAVANGTVALHLALCALGVGAGDEVIVPTLTYVAPVNTIAYVGAEPVFADSLVDTWNIDPDEMNVSAKEARDALWKHYEDTTETGFNPRATLALKLAWCVQHCLGKQRRNGPLCFEGQQFLLSRPTAFVI